MHNAPSGALFFCGKQTPGGFNAAVMMVPAKE